MRLTSIRMWNAWSRNESCRRIVMPVEDEIDEITCHRKKTSAQHEAVVVLQVHSQRAIRIISAWMVSVVDVVLIIFLLAVLAILFGFLGGYLVFGEPRNL